MLHLLYDISNIIFLGHCVKMNIAIKSEWREYDAIFTAAIPETTLAHNLKYGL